MNPGTVYAYVPVEDVEQLLAEGILPSPSMGPPPSSILFLDAESGLNNFKSGTEVVVVSIDTEGMDENAFHDRCPNNALMIDILGQHIFCTAAIPPQRLTVVETLTCEGIKSLRW